MKAFSLNHMLNRPWVMAGLISLFGIFFVWVAFSFQGTGDAGDSIVHFQFARFAYEHPENFLDSWAKPVFVLLASPAARFGLIGLKIFNVVLVLLTAFVLHRTLMVFNIRLAWMSVPFLFAAPLFFIMMFSGLTEYLFAFFLTAAIYLSVKGKFCWAALLVSFLPFVRSEGLLILPFFALYFAVKRQWLPLPLFFAGHLVYALAGLIAGKDFFWMFTQNAYLSYSDQYGSGDWFHFFRQLAYVTGFPLYFLFGLGLLLLVIRLFSRKAVRGNLVTEKWLLIFLPFVLFFAAHTVFWKFGLFHSMGLKRVLISVLPLLVFIVVDGLDFLYGLLAKKNEKAAVVLVVLVFAAVAGFPFSSGPAAVHPGKDLQPGASQIMIAEVSAQLIREIPLDRYDLVYCSHPYLQFLLGMDPFDRDRLRKVREFSPPKASGQKVVVIWDCEVGPGEDGVLLESLMKHRSLKFLRALPEKQAEPCFFVFVNQ